MVRMQFPSHNLGDHLKNDTQRKAVAGTGYFHHFLEENVLLFCMHH